MRRQGLFADESLTGSSHYIAHCMEKYLPRLLYEQQVTAIICSHDQLANAAMVQCQELGKKIPEDLSIIGFDDLPMSPYTAPPLTTIRQDRPQLGSADTTRWTAC